MTKHVGAYAVVFAGILLMLAFILRDFDSGRIRRSRRAATVIVGGQPGAVTPTAGMNSSPALEPNTALTSGLATIAQDVNYRIVSTGTAVNAYNQATGVIDFTIAGTDATTVIQAAINAFPSGGGVISCHPSVNAAGQVVINAPNMTLFATNGFWTTVSGAAGAVIHQLTLGTSGNTTVSLNNIHVWGFEFRELDFLCYSGMSGIAIPWCSITTTSSAGEAGIVFDNTHSKILQYVEFGAVFLQELAAAPAQSIHFIGPSGTSGSGHIRFNHLTTQSGTANSNLILCDNGAKMDSVSFDVLDVESNATSGTNSQQLFTVVGGANASKFANWYVGSLRWEIHQTNPNDILLNITPAGAGTLGVNLAINNAYVENSASGGWTPCVNNNTASWDGSIKNRLYILGGSIGGSAAGKVPTFLGVNGFTQPSDTVNDFCVSVRNFRGVTPFGLITACFGSGSSGQPLGCIAPWNTAANTTVNGRKYAIQGSNCIINSTGGTVTNIVIQDNFGNTVVTGVTTLTNQWLSEGWTITWTESVAPTVTVQFVD